MPRSFPALVTAFSIALAAAFAGALTAACEAGRSADSASGRFASFSAEDSSAHQAGTGPDPVLPEPLVTESATRLPNVIGWPAKVAPVAPAGFRVSLFADSLEQPRWLHVLPNGDVLVAESQADRVTLLRDADRDGRAEHRAPLITRLDRPFGMLFRDGALYVAATDRLVRYAYRPGATRMSGPQRKLLDLPAGALNANWTRNVVASPDGRKLYVTVGSATNVDEEGVDAREPQRATILEMNRDGSDVRVFASGLRNPVGLAWAPGTAILWTVVNERDGLGDELVPDYLTSVRRGAFYGWPYAYFGPHEDPRQRGRRPDLLARTVKPDYALGSHVSPLGLLFYSDSAFPAEYRGGAFIAMHGSWNRSRFAGYRVAFVPFSRGRPSGPIRTFLTGFVAPDGESDVYGRPAGLALLADGSLLVADDGGNRVWRVAWVGEAGGR